MYGFNVLDDEELFGAIKVSPRMSARSSTRSTLRGAGVSSRSNQQRQQYLQRQQQQGQQGQQSSYDSGSYDSGSYSQGGAAPAAGGASPEEIADQVIREMGLFGAMDFGDEEFGSDPFPSPALSRREMASASFGALSLGAPAPSTFSRGPGPGIPAEWYGGLPSTAPRPEAVVRFPINPTVYGTDAWPQGAVAPPGSGHSGWEAVKLGAGIGVGFLGVGLAAGLLARAFR